MLRWLTASVVVALVLAPPASADLFAPPADFAAGGIPIVVATGDFNRDGDRDIVVGNNGAGHLLTAGHGLSFGPPAPLLSFGGRASGVTVADFNADGDEDLAFATFSGVLTVVRDDDGGFAAPVQILSGLMRDVAAGDFNRDGDPDLVALQEFSPFFGFAQPTLGLPGAAFSSAGLSNYALPAGQRAAAVSDFDGDGNQDVVAVTSTALTVLLGTGGGAFAAQPPLPGGTELWSIDVGDFNGDGDPDLAVADFFGDGVVVRLGGAGGTFGAPSTYPLGSTTPTGVAAADFDADGDLDLAVTLNGDHVRVLLGDGDGTFTLATQTYPVGLSPEGLVIDDFNGDGRPDLATANSNSDTVSVLLNAAEPAIETDPSGLNFGTQPQTTISAPRTIKVHSTGERALRIQRLRKIGLTPDDYLITTDTCTGAIVAPGGTCTIAVRFAPEAAGPHEANLQIDSDAPVNGIFDVPLNGTGGALPAGPGGPAGPPGSDGSPGVSANARALLATVFAADRQSVRAGKRLRLRYVSTMDALVTVELRRGTRVARRFTATAVAGRNTLTFRPPGRGRYTLALTAVAGDQRVTDTARLTVLRRRT